MYETDYVFTGKKLNGKFIADKPKMYQSHIDSFEDKSELEIIVRPKRRKATTKQFGFYFGGIIKGTCMKATLFEGWKAKEIDDFFRSEFAWHYEKVNGSEKKVNDDIALYTTEEMKKFVDDVIQYLAESGIEVLDPSEYISSKVRSYFNPKT